MARVGADAELAADVQAQLAAAGLLDPPADRLFGPVSHWALAEYLQYWGLADADAIDMQVASALLQADVSHGLLKPVAWAPHDYQEALFEPDSAVLYRKVS